MCVRVRVCVCVCETTINTLIQIMKNMMQEKISFSSKILFYSGRFNTR